MDALAEIIRYLLIFVAVMFAMLIVLVLVISLLPQSNPLKRILTALSYRIAATFFLGAVAVPVEFIPGVDVAYDVAAPAFLLWFWYTFFRDAGRSNPARRPAKGPTIIDVTPKRK